MAGPYYANIITPEQAAMPSTAVTDAAARGFSNIGNSLGGLQDGMDRRAMRAERMRREAERRAIGLRKEKDRQDAIAAKEQAQKDLELKAKLDKERRDAFMQTASTSGADWTPDEAVMYASRDNVYDQKPVQDFIDLRYPDEYKHKTRLEQMMYGNTLKKDYEGLRHGNKLEEIDANAAARRKAGIGGGGSGKKPSNYIQSEEELWQEIGSLAALQTEIEQYKPTAMQIEDKQIPYQYTQGTKAYNKKMERIGNYWRSLPPGKYPVASDRDLVTVYQTVKRNNPAAYGESLSNLIHAELAKMEKQAAPGGVN